MGLETAGPNWRNSQFASDPNMSMLSLVETADMRSNQELIQPSHDRKLLAASEECI